MYVAFDRDFARSQGIPTRLISYTMSALIAADLAADYSRNDRQYVH